MSKDLPIDHPEYKDQQRRKEGLIPLSDAEKSKIIEYLKSVKKLVPVEKLAKLNNIPSWRTHQILQSLKGETMLNFVYLKGEWFVECLK